MIFCVPEMREYAIFRGQCGWIPTSYLVAGEHLEATLRVCFYVPENLTQEMVH